MLLSKMNKKTTARLASVCLLSLGSFSMPICAQAEQANDEAVISKAPTKSMSELLQQLEKDRYASRKENQKREKAFLADKNKQQSMLKSMKTEQKKQEALSAKLETAFESNEKRLNEAEMRLKERMGSLSELFGHLTTAAGDARSQNAVSLTSLHYPERAQLLQDLVDVSASGSELPSIAQIESLFFELQRELIEQGRAVSFKHEVSNAQGLKEVKTLTRVGNFNVFDEQGQYLSYKEGSLQVLAKQPSDYVGLASNYSASGDAMSAVGVDPTGPSGGSLLAALINTPTLAERWHQGGLVGMVITILGVVAVLLGFVRLFVLAGLSAKVNKQLSQVQSPDESNPLGRVLFAAAKNNQSDLETLELKINEAIIRELPALQRGEGFLKISAAIAPLLGLLGTVVGMILTFQAITIYGAGDPQAMAGGISSALVTTVLGLVVAIPTLLMHSFVSSRSGHIIHILEEQAAGLVAEHNEKHNEQHSEQSA